MESGSPATGGYRRIVLVGFMGSGKSTVGPLLASHLGWSFLDFDEEIERRAGASVEDIFRTQGEPFFRGLEAEVAGELLRLDRAVLATGGGWPAVPGRMDVLAGDTLSVWLDVDADTSVERVRRGGRARPLLEVPDPVGRAKLLLSERASFYGRARLRLDASSASPAAIAERVLEHMNAVSRGDAGGREGP